jgi:alkyl hydroperoxide reductase subunit AhpF
MSNHPILSAAELQALLSTEANSPVPLEPSITPSSLSAEMKFIQELQREVAILSNKVSRLEEQLSVRQASLEEANPANASEEVSTFASRSEKFGYKAPLAKRILKIDK